MPIKWTVFIIAFWVGVSMTCMLCEGAYFDSDPEKMTTLEELQNCQTFTSDDLVGKVVGVFNPDLWGVLLRCATLEFDIFYGEWLFFRYLLLLPISGGIILTAAYSAVRLVRGGG